jgi:hypothetical protein
MSGDLIPEQRVDRNGRVVTRHVRTGATPAPTRLIPKLAAMFGAKREPAEVEARIEWITHSPRFGTLDRSSQKKLLATLHPQTMKTLAKHGITTGGYSEVISMDIIGYSIIRRSLVALNDMAEYIDDYGAFRGNTYGDFEPMTYILGLQEGAVTHIDRSVYFPRYSRADSDQRAAQHAIIEATRKLNPEYVRFSSEEDGMITRRLNSELTQCLLDNHEKADQIVRVINKRGIDPTGKGLEAIMAIVANGEEIGTTLSEGAL